MKNWEKFSKTKDFSVIYHYRSNRLDATLSLSKATVYQSASLSTELSDNTIMAFQHHHLPIMVFSFTPNLLHQSMAIAFSGTLSRC